MGFFLIYQILWSLWLGRNEQLLGTTNNRTVDFYGIDYEILDHIRAVSLAFVPGHKWAQLVLVADAFTRSWVKGLAQSIVSSPL